MLGWKCDLGGCSYIAACTPRESGRDIATRGIVFGGSALICDRAPRHNVYIHTQLGGKENRSRVILYDIGIVIFGGVGFQGSVFIALYREGKKFWWVQPFLQK